MTVWSWIYMGLVWAAIIALNAFCFSRIFRRSKQRQDASAPEDDTMQQ